MRNITDTTGSINSVYPPTEYLTFGPWIYMVPQYRPEDMLFLGFDGGTSAGLVRLLYGSLPITAIDLHSQGDYDERYNVRLIKADAREYIKHCTPYDCVVVDLFDDGDNLPCEFISSVEFSSDLKKIARYIIVHANKDTNMTAYGDPIKVLSLNNSVFYYYMVYEIPGFPIR